MKAIKPAKENFKRKKTSASPNYRSSKPQNIKKYSRFKRYKHQKDNNARK